MPTKRRKRKRRYGDGCIYRRGDLWYFKIHIPGQKPHYAACGTTDKAEAEEFRRKRVSELRAGKDITHAGQLTVDDLLGLVERDYAVKQRKSLPDAQRRMRLHLRPKLGDIKASRFTSNIWEDYILARRREAKPGTDNNATINHEGNLLKRGFNLARRKGLFLGEPPYIERLEEPPPPEGYCPHSTYLALREASPFWFEVFLVLDYGSGMRRSEILGDNRKGRLKDPLRWTQVNFEKALIFLSYTKEGAPKKIPINSEMMAILRAAYDDHRLNYPDCPYVVHYYGKPVYDPRKTWNRVRKAAGVPSLTMHDFRRTHITDSDDAKVSRTVSKAISGHKTDKTHDRYNQVPERRLRSAGYTLEDYRAEQAAKPIDEPKGIVQ